MSQAGLIDIESANPQIPTQFDTDSGTAIPIANTLEILGGAGITTSGSGNTVTVSLTGGGAGIDEINVDAFTAPGTNPVLPTGTGAITITGAQVASSIVGANVIRTDSLAANSLTLEVQQSGSAGAQNTALNGVSHFNSGQFSVTNGFVSLSGAGLAIDSIAVDTGASPIVPTAGGLVTINGAVVAAGTNPVRTDGTGANTLAVEVQTSQAIAAADATKIGLCNFDSSSFAVAATGFVTASTTGLLKTLTGDTGGALSPTANNINILGGPGVTTSGSGSTLTINSVVFTDQAASTAITSDSGSFCTNGAGIILDLPTAPTQGELIEVVCTTANAVAIDAPVADFIRAGTLITSSGGTLTSTAIGDSVVMRFNTANQTWYCTSLIGTWLVA